MTVKLKQITDSTPETTVIVVVVTNSLAGY